jgi:hypothetical protein
MQIIAENMTETSSVLMILFLVVAAITGWMAAFACGLYYWVLVSVVHPLAVQNAVLREKMKSAVMKEKLDALERFKRSRRLEQRMPTGGQPDYRPSLRVAPQTPHSMAKTMPLVDWADPIDSASDAEVVTYSTNKSNVVGR